jgi:hypothetical protein
MALRSALPLLALGAAACVAPGTDAAGSAWYAGRSQDAERQLLALEEKCPDGRALYQCELGVVALDRFDLDVAYRRFLEADLIMGSFSESDSKEIAAILGTEAAKVWKGDPYEQAMNSWYLGIVNLLRGVDDNALAGFKNAVFVDSARDESFSCDFAPALFLEGVSYERLGDAAMAERSLARARELAPSCSALAEGNRGNVIVVLDVGRGPTKANVGAHGEGISYVDHPVQPASIDVIADGERLGATEVAGDVFFQATTRGGRVFDYVLQGKSIYKSTAQAAGMTTLFLADDLSHAHEGTALLVGGALLLSSLLVDARADTRHWTTLPARVHLFRGSLPPGVHEIEIVPAAGWRVVGSSRQVIDVPDPGSGPVAASGRVPGSEQGPVHSPVVVWRRVLQ